MRSILLLVSFWWAAAAAAQDLPVERWLRQVRTGLPVALCAEGTAVRTCFSRTQEQCEQGIASATRACLADMRSQIPESIRMPDQGRQLGGEIGECTVNAYAAANQAAYADTAACRAARAEDAALEQEAGKAGGITR